ncbi:MAG: AAA family ATPase [Acidobacteria bacterium]|nr:AAA family ATPase [Acidobacteriota bacterium]
MVIHSSGSRSAVGVAELVSNLRLGAVQSTSPVPLRTRTGFDVLDMVLDGGLAPTELTLLAGRPGIGKTITALQWARAIAGNGQKVAYVCFEHGPKSLLGRLLLSEIRELQSSTRTSLDRADLNSLVGADGVDATSPMTRDPLVRAAAAQLEELGDNLVLVDADARTTPLEIEKITQNVCSDGSGVVFVDYLQRVPLGADATGDSSWHAGVVAERLKEIAKDHQVSVVAISSLDYSGLNAKRVRPRHVAGPALISYEADSIIVLNAKSDIVSQGHVADDSRRLDEFERKVVFSIEKNRSGESDVDLEFERDFAWYRFNPEGVFTSEHLVDEIHHKI